MSESVERFTGRVAEYARYRLPYSREVVDWLVATCGLAPEWIVADVGAGTGMLAELFLENGHAVVAVEPNAEMRAQCEQLQERFARLCVVDGTAERTGLDASSVDLVSVGRAFHWFDPLGAAAEFRRVLRPGGWVAIVSAGRARDDGGPQELAYEQVLMEHGTDYKENRLRYETGSGVRSFFAGGQTFETEMRTEQRMNLEELLGQTQSLSVAPPRGDRRFAGMQHALSEFFSRWAVNGVLTVPTVCRVTCGRFGD